MRINFLVYSTLIFLYLTGCTKSNENILESDIEGYNLKIQVDGVEDPLELLMSNNFNTDNSSLNEEISSVEGSEILYSTSFETEKNNINSRNINSGVNSKYSATPLANNIIYRFILFKKTGNTYNYVGHKDGTKSSSFVNTSLIVYKDSTYKWVAYSYNNTNAISDVVNQSSFVINTPVDRDLLYDSGDITIPNNNSLVVPDIKVNINFKHRLARIGVAIRGNDFPATITNLTARLGNNSTTYLKSGVLNLLDNTLTNVQGVSYTSNISFTSLNSDSTRIGYLYTADFENALPNLNVHITNARIEDIYSFRDGVYPIIQNKNFEINSKSVTAQAGRSYRATLKILNTEGVKRDNLLWARGNLTYNPSTGGYSIRKGPYTATVSAANDYWLYNSLTPYDATITQRSDIDVAVYQISKDPCRQVPGGWRLPTSSELFSLGSSSRASSDRLQSSGWASSNGVTWGAIKPALNIIFNQYTSFKGDDGQWVTFYKSGRIDLKGYGNRTNYTPWAILLGDSVWSMISDGGTGVDTDIPELDNGQNYFKNGVDPDKDHKVPVRCVKPI